MKPQLPPTMPGILFIFTAATFLLGWLLMPDAGTADARHILEAVAAHRSPVWWSVVTHIACSIGLVGAVTGVISSGTFARSAMTRCGGWLVLVGAMGLCMDGFFHLVAFYMIAPGVEWHGVVHSMRLLQTDGIRFLIPLLLAMFAGGAVFSRGAFNDGIVSVWPSRIFILALALGICGGLMVAALRHGRIEVVWSFLTLVSLGYARLGYDLLKAKGEPVIPLRKD